MVQNKIEDQDMNIMQLNEALRSVQDDNEDMRANPMMPSSFMEQLKA